MTRSEDKRARNDAASWKDTGRKLAEERAEEHQNMRRLVAEIASRVMAEPHEAPTREWSDAVHAACNGDPSRLVEYLRSERALTRTDRDLLATFLPSMLKKGRPGKDEVKSLARVALVFYQEWKQLNRRLGIRDHGHADDMKQQACRVALALMNTDPWRVALGLPPVLNPASTVPPTVEAVRELMDRPKSRRG
jgi:hypothetical protein